MMDEFNERCINVIPEGEGKNDITPSSAITHTGRRFKKKKKEQKHAQTDLGRCA